MGRQRGEIVKSILKLAFLALFLTAINIPGLAAGQTIEFIEETVEPDEMERIELTVIGYEQNLVKAINENRFAAVEPYLLPNSAIYHGQKSLVKQLSMRGIKERFIACELIDCEVVNDQRYKVYVQVTIAFLGYRRQENVKVSYWIYTLGKGQSGFRLADIEEWKNYQDYIAQQQTNAKPDGYYRMELLRYYGAIFIEAVNSLNITPIKAISENKSVLAIQKRMIIRLRKISSQFELAHYTVAPVEESPDQFDLLMDFKPMRTDQAARVMTLKFCLTLKEIRKCFRSYAVITEIKELK